MGDKSLEEILDGGVEEGDSILNATEESLGSKADEEESILAKSDGFYALQGQIGSVVDSSLLMYHAGWRWIGGMVKNMSETVCQIGEDLKGKKEEAPEEDENTILEDLLRGARLHVVSREPMLDRKESTLGRMNKQCLDESLAEPFSVDLDPDTLTEMAVNGGFHYDRQTFEDENFDDTYISLDIDRNVSRPWHSIERPRDADGNIKKDVKCKTIRTILTHARMEDEDPSGDLVTGDARMDSSGDGGGIVQDDAHSPSGNVSSDAEPPLKRWDSIQSNDSASEDDSDFLGALNRSVDGEMNGVGPEISAKEVKSDCVPLLGSTPLKADSERFGGTLESDTATQSGTPVFKTPVVSHRPEKLKDLGLWSSGSPGQKHWSWAEMDPLFASTPQKGPRREESVGGTLEDFGSAKSGTPNKHSSCFKTPTGTSSPRSGKLDSLSFSSTRSQVSVGGNRVSTPCASFVGEEAEEVQPDQDKKKKEPVPCTAECEEKLPNDWGKVLYEALCEVFKDYCENHSLANVQMALYRFEYCDACENFRWPFCGYGADCQDMIKLMRIVQPHSGRIRVFLRSFYILRAMNHWLTQLDLAYEEGDLFSLLKLMEGVGLDMDKRMELEKMTKPKPDAPNCVELKEKFQGLIAAFERERNAWPKDICSICSLWVKAVHVFPDFESVPWKNDEVKNAFQGRLGEMRDIKICKSIGSLVSCFRSIQKIGEIPKLCLENEVGIDDLPECLRDLNSYEEMLVQLAKPFITVVRLQPYRCKKGASEFSSNLYRAMRGCAIHFPMSVEESVREIATTLPNQNWVTVLVDGIPTKQNVVWRSLVRMVKVVEALNWLKERNPNYFDITIADVDGSDFDQMMEKVVRLVSGEVEEEDVDSALAELDGAAVQDQSPSDDPVRGDAMEQNEEGKDEVLSGDAVSGDANKESGKEKESSGGPSAESVEETNKPVLPSGLKHVDEAEKIRMIEFDQYSIHPLQDKLPEVTDTELYRKLKLDVSPLNEREESQLEQKCFVKGYPLGKFGPILENPRRRKISHQDFLKSRVLHKNGIFRRDPQYLFFKMDQQNRRDMESGIFCTMSFTNARRLTAGQLTSGVAQSDKRLESCMNSMYGKIPGSKKYWENRRCKF